ncbi:MAG: methylmalonyl-CoA mutase family protein [Actinomycetota bacterium]|nr:methylmalonyl-CoA mutase family protein [Actinomycetota bacterium]
MTNALESRPNLNHKVRFVTATTLFDGHDASINIFRRILQAAGAEVIHLGHNRSGVDIVEAAIDEDVQAIAVTSYQGGHMEFYRYLRDLLVERDADHIRLFGGGGGTILPWEGRELEEYGITRIYSPDDGRQLGLVGMVHDMLERSDFATGELDDEFDPADVRAEDRQAVATLISAAENYGEKYEDIFEQVSGLALQSSAPVIGITGTGGSGKSSLVDEMVRRLLLDFPGLRLAIISVDPSKRKSGGALLGDRIRMNSLPHDRVYMRSLATRQANLALSPHVHQAVDILKAAGFDLVILETSGIGQSDTEIVDQSDMAMYVMTPEYGAATQLEKIDMLDFADLVAINKADKEGALDALRDVRKQYRRNQELFEGDDDSLPVHLTVASDFNDPGTNRFYEAFVTRLQAWGMDLKSSLGLPMEDEAKTHVIPPERSRYLAEIVDQVRRYNKDATRRADAADRLYRLSGAADATESDLSVEIAVAQSEVGAEGLKALERWDGLVAEYSGEEFIYHVRGREIRVPLHHETLSHTRIPLVALPHYRSWGDRLEWLAQENVPGEFPFAAGVFPFKRSEEDPTRMFAGEGPPEQTNARFHYLAAGMPSKRLSTAFDSVTLYGEDPHERPDIYGKVGNSGVSIATLDDAKKLYSGFDLSDPSTSVSMTINGPAPMILAFFMNTAIDQACERYVTDNDLWDEVQPKVDAIAGEGRASYVGDLPAGNDGLGLRLLGVSGDQILPPDVYKRLKAETISRVRGTVQADILKEDQAQNTCIFSTEFALRMMGDIQQYFVANDVRNFYSVSISGYHMAEAGANPITQLAFTLANGFTYVENYLARGMDIDDFAPNLSYFFSNGIDAEYAVIGRVARRIWAKAIKYLYGGNERSQKLKYHIQTSGRSLHAQEIGFNDIRTTLQALYAIYDNTNSLHTNAYDEALTTPTEESVRRALAIQMIINRELGLAKNENPMQGSFIISELTDLVEEAVLIEFERINSRGGVLGAMERQYQRTKIQEESLYYEQQKESGEYPIVGVNTFLSKDGSPFEMPNELIRSRDQDKERQISSLRAFQARNSDVAEGSLAALQETAVHGKNVFEQLMETAKVASLGQMSRALYDVGGQYRRNM